MSARERILAAVRAGLGAGGPGRDIGCDTGRSPARVAAEAAALLADPGAIRPRLAALDLAEAFRLKAEAVGATVERVAAMAAVPEAVRRYLAGHGLPPALALERSPELAALDWGGLQTSAALAPDQPAALGLALWGVAESGSLAVASGPGAPVLLAFLPLHHILVLPEARLLPHLEDWAARLDAAPQPRNAILITGPSGTTDIEGSYVRGAHGPGFVHVLLVGGVPRTGRP